MASLLPPPQFIGPGEGELLPLDSPVPVFMVLASGWSLFISPETPRPLLLLYLSFSGGGEGRESSLEKQSCSWVAPLVLVYAFAQGVFFISGILFLHSFLL